MLVERKTAFSCAFGVASAIFCICATLICSKNEEDIFMNKIVLKKLVSALLCTLLVPVVFSLGGCAPSDNTGLNEGYTLRGIVKKIDDKIEIDVTEGEYAEGIYLVIYSSARFVNSEGEAASIGDMSVGDEIEVTYGGQVMMSYPPQVAASVIRILGE